MSTTQLARLSLKVNGLIYGSAGAMVLLIAGCMHEQAREPHSSAEQAARRTRPMIYLSGPASLVLTNSNGFIARLVITLPPSGPEQTLAGQLIGKGPRLWFQPEPDSGKSGRAGQFSFIWDAGLNQGYILSEALQGYAPFVPAIRFTNVVFQAMITATGKTDGRGMEHSMAVVTGTDGKQARLEVAPARDLGGLPARISLMDDPSPFVLTLSRVRLEPVPDGLFTPPAGFTRYENQEALLNELAARQAGSGRSGRDGSGGRFGGGRGHH